MRTTLDLDEDVLLAAKALAEARGIPAGQAASELARKGLAAPRAAKTRKGVPFLPRRQRPAGVPTLELVNRLRDEA